jgi:PIN domain
MQLRPQIRLHEAIKYLEAQIYALGIALGNVHGSDAMESYLKWIDRAARELPDRFANGDLVEMLHTPHYWHIRNPNNELNFQKADLIAHELRIHMARLEKTRDHLRLFEPMTRRYGEPVVLDTNVLVNFDPLSDRISYDRWLEITGHRNRIPFSVVIPALVIDEMDRFSHTGDRTLNVKARKALSGLDRFIGALEERKAVPVWPDQGWMTAEILPDAPGHRRQVDDDMELLDRAQFLYQITNKPVALVTADRGMRIRGMVHQILTVGSGVNVVAMPEDLRVQDQPQLQRRRQPDKAQRYQEASTGSQPTVESSIPPDPTGELPSTGQ